MAFFSFIPGGIEIPLVDCFSEPCPGGVDNALSTPTLEPNRGAKNIAFSTGNLIDQFLGLFGADKEKEITPPADTAPDTKELTNNQFFSRDTIFALLFLSVAVGAILFARRK